MDEVASYRDETEEYLENAKSDIKKIQPSYETIYPDILRYVTDTILKEHHGGKLNE